MYVIVKINRSRYFYTNTELPKLFNEAFLRVKGIISMANNLSFSTDSWESRDQVHSILSLTCHYLEPDSFEPKFFVLDAAPIKGITIHYKFYLNCFCNRPS